MNAAQTELFKDHYPSQNRLGLTIRRLRRAAKMTQGELSALAEITPAHLSNIESGRRVPSQAVLETIARALGSNALELEQARDLDAGTVQLEMDGISPTLCALIIEIRSQWPITDECAIDMLKTLEYHKRKRKKRKNNDIDTGIA